MYGGGFRLYKPILQHRASHFIVYNNAMYKDACCQFVLYLYVL